MKVAYFTPLNPKRSGISDYNEELLLYLKDHLDIHLFLDGYIPSNKMIAEKFPCFDVKEFEHQHSIHQYVTCIYHMGNNNLYHEYMYQLMMEYSGIVVMHDYAIHHLMAAMLLEKGKTAEYLEEIRYNSGEEGFQEAQKALRGEIPPLWETSSIKYPMNKRIIDFARGIIVHSEFVKDLIKQKRSDLPLKVIPHHCANIVDDPLEVKQSARKKLNIGKNKFIMASFGHVVPSKRIDVVLRTLNRIKNDFNDFTYYIVGEETKNYPIRNLVKELGLTKNVIITGYTDLEMFKTYMQATDLCLNLRYPVQGETSGSLLRLLGMGKAVVVSNEGSFSELDDDVVVKINVDEKEEENLFETLKSFINSTNKIDEMGIKAWQYVKQNCTLENSAVNYGNFVKEIIENSGVLETITARKIIDSLAEKLLEIGVTGRNRNIIAEAAYLLDEIGIR